jgi:hypothetical protein
MNGILGSLKPVLYTVFIFLIVTAMFAVIGKFLSALHLPPCSVGLRGGGRHSALPGLLTTGCAATFLDSSPHRPFPLLPCSLVVHCIQCRQTIVLQNPSREFLRLLRWHVYHVRVCVCVSSCVHTCRQASMHTRVFVLRRASPRVGVTFCLTRTDAGHMNLCMYALACVCICTNENERGQVPGGDWGQLGERRRSSYRLSVR